MSLPSTSPDSGAPCSKADSVDWQQWRVKCVLQGALAVFAALSAEEVSLFSELFCCSVIVELLLCLLPSLGDKVLSALLDWFESSEMLTRFPSFRSAHHTTSTGPTTITNANLFLFG